MIGAVLAVGMGALRRLLLPVPVLLTVGAGALVGLLVRGLPEPELAAQIFPILATALGAIVVLPLAAGWICAERQGGFEQLVAVRPLASLSWTLGRMGGSVVGAGALLLLLFAVARVVGGSVQVPKVVEGVRMDVEPSLRATVGAFDGDWREGLDAGLEEPERVLAIADGPVEWRFPVPAEHPGPYELQLEALVSRAGRHAVTIDLRRGGVPLALGSRPISGRRVRLSLPDLAPARGDLFVTLHPSPGLRFEASAPRLVVGRMPLGRAGLPPPVGSATRLLVALLAAVAAASAFRFETACLAALLALAVDPAGHPLTLALSIAVLLVFATVGTALARRTAIP
jgi:hypothetical protein